MQAKKRLGQHFLIDRGAVARATKALAPSPGEAVLEIGPGRGAWTSSLIARAGHVTAIERDADLIPELRSCFGDALTLIHEDALVCDWNALRERVRPDAERWVLASNLPYNISKPICGRLVAERTTVERAVLMFQREVGDRLVAATGDRAYGALTVWTNLHFRIERLFDLRPGAFRPPPAVHSTVTSWVGRDDAPDDPTGAVVSAWLRHAFHAPRKTLANNLRRGLDRTALDALPEAWLAGRPGDRSPAEFLELAGHLGPPPG